MIDSTIRNEKCCLCQKEMPYNEWIRNPFCSRQCEDEFWTQAVADAKAIRCLDA